MAGVGISKRDGLAFCKVVANQATGWSPYAEHEFDSLARLVAKDLVVKRTTGKRVAWYPTPRGDELLAQIYEAVTR